jgi:hypothetical protein
MIIVKNERQKESRCSARQNQERKRREEISFKRGIGETHETTNEWYVPSLEIKGRIS